jgi:hypothetical protein
MNQQLLMAEDVALQAHPCRRSLKPYPTSSCGRVQLQLVCTAPPQPPRLLARFALPGTHTRRRRACPPGQNFYPAGFMAVLGSSFKNDRMKIPTMYVTLSNVSAVAKPVVSMR